MIFVNRERVGRVCLREREGERERDSECDVGMVWYGISESEIGG